MDQWFKTGYLKAADKDKRELKFILSDDSEDRHGHVIIQSGWKLDNFNRNGIVPYMHNAFSSDPDDVVAKGRAFLENGKLMGIAQFQAAEHNPKAQKVYQKYLDGYLNTVSVGLDPISWHWGIEENGEDPDILYLTSQELQEFSPVTIPANVNAEMVKSLKDWVKEKRSERKATKTIIQVSGIKNIHNAQARARMFY